MPLWILDLTLSDYTLMTFAFGVLWFTVDYGIFTPWWRHPIGWVVFSYSLSVLGLMSLILFGIVAGQRVDEWARLIVGILLVAGIVGKIIVLHVSRREGRIERRKNRQHPRGDF